MNKNSDKVVNTRKFKLFRSLYHSEMLDWNFGEIIHILRMF